MLEIQGKYNKANIYTDVVERESISQVMNLLNQPFTEGLNIRMMPDIHAGAGCTIGTTLTVQDKIVPNLVGVDIGCGMYVSRLREKHIELQKLDKTIYEKVPSGFSKRGSVHRFSERIDLSELRCAKEINIDNALVSLGTLGGGNHFIELDKDEDGSLYLVIHTGSRHLGLEVANYYQEEAYRRLTHTDKASIEKAKREVIERLKEEHREQDIQKELKSLKAGIHTDVPKPLAYCEEELFDDYIHDMKIVQDFAALNRKAITDEIVRNMKLHVEDEFTTIHNYIDTDAMILRKGAVSAQAGERLIIPINMRDGSLICIGKGNPDWNFSAPHGAGRLMSRSAAKESFTVSEFKKQMTGIYTTSANSSTLDECPMAYKGMADIVDNIGPTAEIVSIIKPVYNFKAGTED